MSKPRMSIFGSEAEAEFDVSAFAPKAHPRTPPPATEVRALAEAMNFRSREAPGGPAVAAAGEGTDPAVPQRRKPRRHRTGRTAQLNVRTTPQTVDAFYAIADEEGWLVGETVEQALAALQRERAARGG
ncbi:stability/partitioning determinant [Acuticoccus sediminis]|uniref:stability/partitioning determinant n=1 Tax=Acuticoccus sediminis TaxID=2184697 RepID=UPI001CFE0C3C|nr:stability/partitioning determinant [Acuticoccus sediminis]